jgi:uncharacterized protein (DUF4213/DUF364 family)
MKERLVKRRKKKQCAEFNMLIEKVEKIQEKFEFLPVEG